VNLPDSGPYVCLITQGKATNLNFESERSNILQTVSDAVADGVNLIQIREKALTARLLFDLVSEAVAMLAGTNVRVVVNDRVDIAVAAGADGVHLPADSFVPAAIRKAFQNELMIGVSTHSTDEAVFAARSGADYVFFGPVFETPGKGPPIGIEKLAAVCRELKTFPVIALGGIDENNLDDVLSEGAAGIAAIRSLHETASRDAICARLRTIAG